jgi:hypothetical protein
MQSGFGPPGGQPPGYPPGAPADVPPGWGQQPPVPSQQSQGQPYGAPGAQPYGAPAPQPYGAPAGQPYGATPVSAGQPGPMPDPMGYGQAPGMPGYGMQPPGAMPMMSGQYEFGDRENATVNRLAGRLTAAGIAQIVFGALSLLGNFISGIIGGIVGIPGAIALVVIGALFVSAAGSFKQISRTQGNDMGHLMSAMDKLSSAALVQIIGFIAAIVLGAVILAIVAVFFAAMLAAS